MNIGEQIKSKRTELNVTQQELADRLNVSRSAISNWETGKNYPDLQIIVQISEELHVSLDTLLKGDANVVEKIANDTKKSNRLRLLSKKLIAAVIVLTVIILAAIYVFILWTGEITKPEQVKDMRIENHELVIEVAIPSYYGQRYWYVDLDETGTIAHVTIDYKFGKSPEGNNIMKSIVNTENESDPLSKTHMQNLKEIQIVTAKGKVVKSLKITDEMRE